MTKRLLVAILSLALVMHVSGCTSGGSAEDGDVAESNDGDFSEESDTDFADGSEAVEGEATEGAEPAEPADTVADNLDDLGGGDQAAALDSGDAAAAPTDQAANSEAGSGDDLVLDTADPLPEEAATDPSSAPPADPAPAPEAVASTDPTAPPPTDEPVFNTPPADEAPAPAPTDVAAEPAPEPAPTEPAPTDVASEPAPAPAYIPLKKVREQAFAAADGTSLNRVYVARPGDTMKSVSQKIYGKNRSKDLRKWNGKSSLKTGDKLYYASPNDPNDASMKTFYEDIGVQPSTYTSKDGDNIRSVSKQLLGNSQSWKEVWATNPSVESKGDIPAGLEIRYWPEGAEAAAVAAAPKPEDPGAAAGATLPGEVAQDLPPPPSDPTEVPPPPVPGGDIAMNDMPPPGATEVPPPPPPPPPPPGGDPTAMGGLDPSAQNVPPPPPPPPEVPPPPPPEPKPVAKKMQPDVVEGEADPDQMMWLGACGIMLMAAAILYVVIKKNRAKRVDLSQTQV